MKTPAATNVTDASRMGQMTGGRGSPPASVTRTGSWTHRQRRVVGSTNTVRKSAGRSSVRAIPASELRGATSPPLRSSSPMLTEGTITGNRSARSRSDPGFVHLPTIADGTDSHSSLHLPPARAASKEDTQLAVGNSFWGHWLPGLKLTTNIQQHYMSSLLNDVDLNSKINPKFKARPKSEPILVTVNVLGSPGPLRLLVSKTDSVLHIIELALKEYAWQRRQPALMDPFPYFGLYCHDPDFQVLDGEESIGDRRVRQFHLYHKEGSELDQLQDYEKLASMALMTTPAPAKSWLGEGFSRFQSWATKMIGNVQRSLSIFQTWLNPWNKYRFAYMLSMNVLNH